TASSMIRRRIGCQSGSAGKSATRSVSGMAALVPDDEILGGNGCGDEIEHDESPQAIVQIDAQKEWHCGDVQNPAPPELLADDVHATEHEETGQPSEEADPVMSNIQDVGRVEFRDGSDCGADNGGEIARY